MPEIGPKELDRFFTAPNNNGQRRAELAEQIARSWYGPARVSEIGVLARAISEQLRQAGVIFPPRELPDAPERDL